MRFNEHSAIEGKHAFLSASKHSWINYDEEKLSQSYSNFLATQRGTELHAIAKDLISHGINLPRTKQTLNQYVNDAIGYKMTPEQPLYFSDNCFGTADAISFNRKFLRVHDLKTGVTPASMDQLRIYAALFCLEYKTNPGDIQMELRIYQGNDIYIVTPNEQEIRHIMDKIILFDKRIEKMNMEE